jgi:hypothetical protein
MVVKTPLEGGRVKTGSCTDTEGERITATHDDGSRDLDGGAKHPRVWRVSEEDDISLRTVYKVVTMSLSMRVLLPLTIIISKDKAKKPIKALPLSSK